MTSSKSKFSSTRPMTIAAPIGRKAWHPKLSPGDSPTLSEQTIDNSASQVRGQCTLCLSGRCLRQARMGGLDFNQPCLPADRIRINVSGQTYETRAAVFDAHPDTIFGNPEKRRPYWDVARQEYFFDRHRPSFEAIFNFLAEGGRLCRPSSIPVDMFMKEVISFRFTQFNCTMHAMSAC